MKTTILRHDQPDRDLSLVALVVGDLREEERMEAEAIGADPFVNAPRLFLASPAPHVVFLDQDPVFIFGTIPVAPWHHMLWGFGTTKTKRALPAMTRFGRDVWLPYLFREQSLRRVEVRLPGRATGSITWLSAVGMKTECRLDHCGVSDEPFVQLSYTKNDFQKAYTDDVLVQYSRAGSYDSAGTSK